MNEFIGGVVAHIVTGLVGGVIGYIFRENILWLGKFMDPIAKSEARLISGEWTAKETFTDDNSCAQYKLALKCRRVQVTGTQSFMSGRVDKNRKFDLTGSFKNMVLNLTWAAKGSVETGAMTLRYVNDKQLEGHGLYVFNQTVYTSVIIATKD